MPTGMGVGWLRLPESSEDPPPDPLARLGAEIDQARRERLRPGANGRKAPSSGALGLGFRVAIELVAALCVGLALGWVFDRALGTRPWGLIAFFFLGSAAGMLNVFRAAKGVIFAGTAPSSGNGDRSKQQ
jgi:ATP synthase protein I